jgi:hypothetical protein
VNMIAGIIRQHRASKLAVCSRRASSSGRKKEVHHVKSPLNYRNVRDAVRLVPDLVALEAVSLSAEPCQIRRRKEHGATDPQHHLQLRSAMQKFWMGFSKVF